MGFCISLLFAQDCQNARPRPSVIPYINAWATAIDAIEECDYCISVHQFTQLPHDNRCIIRRQSSRHHDMSVAYIVSWFVLVGLRGNNMMKASISICHSATIFHPMCNCSVDIYLHYNILVVTTE